MQIPNMAIRIIRKESLLYLALGIILIVFSTAILTSFLGLKGVVGTLLLILTILALFDTGLMFFLFLVVVFLPYLLEIHQSVIYSIPLLLSALIYFKGDLWKRIKNPILFSLFIYFLCTLPSFVNTSQPLLSLRDQSNLVSLFLVFIATLLYVDSHEKMKRIFYIFVGAVLLHSIYVIYLGITTGNRVFGLLYVYYIDFAGLGGLMSFIFLIYFDNVKKVIASILFGVISLGLIITQTRNAWLSFAVSISSLLVYLLFRNKRFFVKRAQIVGFLLFGTIAIALLYFVAGSYNDKLEKRLDSGGSSTIINPEDVESIGENSLYTRTLIWHTAGMAFLKHPIIGIGAYAFRHVSGEYYTIPKNFYKLFVQNKTPHVTYFEVLTETGILGFVGFLYFLIAIIKHIVKVLKPQQNQKDSMITLIICWSFVYIIFSMSMTESWLYGQYIVWIGILLGCLVNQNLVFKQVIEN
jgi:O-antigen ligase